MYNVDLLKELCFFEDSSVPACEQTGSIERPQLTAFHTPTLPLNGPIEGELQAICLDTPSGKKNQGTWLHNQREQGRIHDLHCSFQVSRLPTTGTLMSCRWGLQALWTGLKLLMASLTISDQHYVLYKLTSPGDGMSKSLDQRPPTRTNNQPVIYVACPKQVSIFRQIFSTLVWLHSVATKLRYRSWELPQ